MSNLKKGSTQAAYLLRRIERRLPPARPLLAEAGLDHRGVCRQLAGQHAGVQLGTVLAQLAVCVFRRIA
jgi:hypothetical protein